MNQFLVGEANQSRKSCWTCKATTPYNQGLCDNCWALVPDIIQLVYNTVHTPDVDDEYQRAVRIAIIETLQSKVRKLRQPEPKPVLTLSDLGL